MARESINIYSKVVSPAKGPSIELRKMVADYKTGVLKEHQSGGTIESLLKNDVDLTLI